MFYVANVIKFSVFLVLLWKSNLIVCYKLNIFRPPRVNQFGKKETHMFYVANVITFSVLLEKPLKSTLIVRYKLNILRPPWVNQLTFVHFYLDITLGS